MDLRRLALILLLLVPQALPAEKATLPVTMDTGLSSTRGHYDDNSGASVTVPLRQNQNWSGFETKAWLGDFDSKAIRGWSVERAWLNLFLARGDLYGLGLCTVLAPWKEGWGVNGATGRGGASWNWASEPSDPAHPAPGDLWCWPGSGVYSVSWFHPDARYWHVDPGMIERSEADSGRAVHIRVPVDPKLVESLACGLSYGLVLTDDKGQVAEGLALKGDAVPYVTDDSHDTFMYTGDIQDPALRPYLEVEGGPADHTAPGAVEALAVAEVEPYDPSVTLSFKAAGDDGAARGAALGYDVRYAASKIDQSAWDSAARVPLWLVPKPEAPGTLQKMRIFDIPAGHYFVALRAMDEAGNLGPLAQVELTLPELQSAALAAAPLESGAGAGKAVAFEDKLELWACPDLAKVDPVGGGVLLDEENYAQDEAFQRENPAWSSGKRTVFLEAGRGEVAAFQLLLGRLGQTKLTNVKVSLSDLSGDPGEIKSPGNVSLFRVWYLDVEPRPEELTGPWELVEQKDHKAAWHGDACLPLEAPFDPSFNLPTRDNMGDFQRWQSVWTDLYVPAGTKPGLYQGKITVTADELKQPAFLILMLKVLPFTIPAQPTWPIDLNCYAYGMTRVSGVDIQTETKRFLDVERSFYQVGHAHRSTLNVLPYEQDGTVQMLAAPDLAGKGAAVKVSDWSKWDSRYGPYLSGKAFTPAMGYRGPGQGQPLTHIYLPFNEDWPMSLKEYYSDYKELASRVDFAEWAKTSRSPAEACDRQYCQGFSSVVRQYFEHFDKQGFKGTAFQVYFNNKYYYKVPFFRMPYKLHGSSFWLLDEPVDYDDYEANRFYMDLVRQGYLASGKNDIALHYRTDVSQPELARGLWDGLCNLWDNSGLLGCASTAMFRMRRLPGENHWRYGGSPKVSGRLIELQENFLTLWAIGATGALPYWDVMGGGDWFNPNDLSVYYSGKNYARSGKNYDGALPGMRLKAIRRAQQDIEYLNLLATKKGWSYLKLRRALTPFADDPTAWPLSFHHLDSRKLLELRRAVAAELSK